jgi:hypothetical protein
MASAVQRSLSPSRDIPFNKLVLSQPTSGVKAGVSTEQLTHRQEGDRETVARAWSSEVAEVAPFTDSEIHIVAGLSLPIWKRLPRIDASVSAPDRFL